MSYWFFVSYARQDSTGDSKLRQFYDELIKEILLLKHFPESNAGFFDVEDIAFGAPWKTELAEALRTCRVFLSLCSPAYVNSDYCGREFRIFSERQDGYVTAKKPANAPHLILPILWGPPNQAYPQLIQDLQYSDGEFPAVYAEQGLNYMMSLNEHKDDYVKFRRRLATIIVEEGERHDLPELKTLLDLKDVKSVFFPASPEERRPGDTLQSGGFKKIWVAYLAARPNELANLRNVQPYGSQGRMEWQPYLPDIDKSIGVLAQEVVSKQNLFYFPLELETTDDLVPVLEKAESNKEIVLIIVDAWTVRIAAYSDLLKPYDKINLSNCSVVIPWNDNDPETSQDSPKLKKAIQETLKYTSEFKRNTVYYRDTITSSEALAEDLMKTLANIRMKLLESADDPEEPIQDDELAVQARQKGIAVETLLTVQGPSGPK